MKVIAKLSRSKVVAGRGHELDLLVQVRAPAPPPDATRSPLLIVPVVDVSGSMAGVKLDSVKHALERLVAHLVPGDMMGLVTFDSAAAVRLPIVEVTGETKRKIRRVIRSLGAGSNTNLAGGLLEAARLVRGARGISQCRTRLILLTDGQANEGVATAAPALVQLVREQLAGLTVSAFGYGDDCDHSLLGNLADTTGGSFAYIENEDAVLTAFARELGGLVATYAGGVRVSVVPEAGAPREEVLGDLLHHGELAAVFDVAIGAHVEATAVPVASVEVTWTDSRGQQQRAVVPARLDHVHEGAEDLADDPDVGQVADERRLARAQERAEELARAGDLEGARDHLKATAKRLNSKKLVAFVYEALLPCYADMSTLRHTVGIRSSSRQAFKGRRLVTSIVMNDRELCEPNEAEKQMEISFRKGRTTH